MFKKRHQAEVARAVQEALRHPICGCGHHWSHHDDKGACHFVTVDHVKKTVVERYSDGVVRLDSFEHPITSTEVEKVCSPCTCQRYYGPEPHPEFVVPPLAQIEGV